jgi:hypothetical protein
MNIQEYGNKVKEMLAKDHEGYEFILDVNVVKNNDITKHGLQIKQKNSSDRVIPVFYLDDFYDNNCKAEEAADSIWSYYSQDMERNMLNTDIDFNRLLNFDYAKQYIIPKIANFEKNKEIIEKSPYIVFGDLLIYFIIIFDNATSGNGIPTSKVINAYLDEWGIDLDELISISFNNLKRMFPVKITNMFDMLKELMERNDVGEDFNFIIDDYTDNYVYVINEANTLFGAVYMASKDTLMEISEHTNLRQYYIIPSSIYEFIVTPDDGNEEKKEMIFNMVKEVNATTVSEYDFLADNVYHFDSETGILTDKDGNELTFPY